MSELSKSFADFFGSQESNDDYISPDTLKAAEEKRQQELAEAQAEAQEIYETCKANGFSRDGLKNWQIQLMIEHGFAYQSSPNTETEYATWEFARD